LEFWNHNISLESRLSLAQVLNAGTIGLRNEMTVWPLMELPLTARSPRYAKSF
jgi:hypothetical protein